MLFIHDCIGKWQLKIHDDELNKTLASTHIACINIYAVTLNREKCHADIFFTDYRSAGVVALHRVTYASTCVIVRVSNDIRSSIEENLCVNIMKRQRRDYNISESQWYYNATYYERLELILMYASLTQKHKQYIQKFKYIVKLSITFNGRAYVVKRHNRSFKIRLIKQKRIPTFTTYQTIQNHKKK